MRINSHFVFVFRYCAFASPMSSCFPTPQQLAVQAAERGRGLEGA